MFEDAIIDAILVLVGLIALLPLEVDEEFLAVGGLSPLRAGGQHATHQLAVVAAPYVVLEGLFRVCAQLALGDCARSPALLAPLVQELSAGGLTFLIGEELNLYNCNSKGILLLSCLEAVLRLGE